MFEAITHFHPSLLVLPSRSRLPGGTRSRASITISRAKTQSFFKNFLEFPLKIVAFLSTLCDFASLREPPTTRTSKAREHCHGSAGVLPSRCKTTSRSLQSRSPAFSLPEPLPCSPHVKPILANRLARFSKNLESRSATSSVARSCDFFILLKKDRFRRSAARKIKHRRNLGFVEEVPNRDGRQ
jgi:hypothetical protein